MFGWVNSFKIHSKKSDMIGREGNKGKGGGEWGKKQNAQEEMNQTPWERSTPSIDEMASTHPNLFFSTAYPRGVCSLEL